MGKGTPSSLLPPQHYGSCHESGGVGLKSRGRSAEACLLLKRGRGESKTSQIFLSVEAMELGGGTEVMVGLVLAGAAVVVTIPDSTTLHPVRTEDRDNQQRAQEKVYP